MSKETKSKDYIQHAVLCAAYAGMMFVGYRADLAIFFLEKAKRLSTFGLVAHLMEEKRIGK